MTTLHRVRAHATHALVCLACAFVVVGCGGDGPQFGGSGGGSAGGNPNFGNAFDGVDNSGRFVQIFLARDPSSQTSPSGSFDASNSRVSISAANNFANLTNQQVSGTFSGDTFSLSVVGGTTRYAGRFVDPDVVELTPVGSSTKYVVTRNVNDQFAPRLSSIWTFAVAPQRSLQLRPSSGFFDDAVTLRFEGTEFDNGTTSPVTGYASVSRVILTIQRTSGPVTLDGRFRKGATGWLTDFIHFTDGTEIRRGGTPDAQRVIFAASDGSSSPRRLIDVDTNGVDRREIAGASSAIPDVSKFAPSPDGSRVAVVSRDLFIVDLATKAVTPITNTLAAGGQVLDVAWAPDGRSIAYISFDSSSSGAAVYMRSLTGGAATPAIASATVRSTTDTSRYRIAWSPSGALIAFTMNLQPAGDAFGLHAASSSGANVKMVWPLLDNVVDFSWSPVGSRIAYRTTNAFELWTDDVAEILKPGGSPSPSLKAQSVDSYVWSGNGSSLAFISGSGSQSNVWKVDVATSSVTRLSPTAYAVGGVVQYLRWAPDNSRVAYLAAKPAGWRWITSDGTENVLTDDKAFTCNSIAPSLSWSPAGNTVAYFTTIDSECQLVLHDLQSNQRRPITQKMQPLFADAGIRWLNDGSRLVFQADADFNNGNDLWIAYTGGTTARKISDRLDGLDTLDFQQGFYLH